MKLKSLTVAFALMVTTLLLTHPPTYSQQPIDSTATIHETHDSVAVHATTAPDLESHDSVIIKTSDSTATKIPVGTITAPSEYTVFGLKLPTWANWVITILLSIAAILPGIQLILKKIPGAETIGGFLGKILDALTWFQKNVLKE